MPAFTGARWAANGPTTTITWSFAVSNYESLQTSFQGYEDFDSPIEAAHRATIEAAFAAWERIANIDFVLSPDAPTVNIRVGNLAIDGRPDAGESTTLAITAGWGIRGAFYSAVQIYFDVDAYDYNGLYSTALHEVGHALGLSHTPFPYAVMYYLNNEQNETGEFSVDDIEGIVSLYGAKAGAVLTDDFAATTLTLGAVAVGGSVTGRIEAVGDTDWFRVNLVAGRTYRFNLEGLDSLQWTLDDPVLEVRSETGALVRTMQDGGVGWNARGDFTATVNGAVFLAARSDLYAPTRSGTYRLSVEDLGVIADDFAASSATTGAVTVGGAVTGKLETHGDADWFRVTLVAGRTYRFDLEGFDSDQWTLDDPVLEIRDQAGALLRSVQDGGVGWNSRTDFTATASGTFYLVAGSYTDSDVRTGTYRLSTQDLGVMTDDFAASAATAGVVAVGGSVTGKLETHGDSDWFRVSLVAGRAYRIDLEGDDSGKGTLDDPWLEIRSPTGEVLKTFDDEGEGQNARGEFTPTTNGSFYLSAGSHVDGDLRTGTYRLSIVDVATTAVTTATTNILRGANASVATDLTTRLLIGTLTVNQAVAELVKAADATTSVATMAYQFFTGKIPSAAGMDYLVSATGPNANNLNSAYYQSFNMENRYINFSVNLGREGEGKAKFLADYGSLSLTEATKKAYGVIFGTVPTDAKVAALLAGGRDLYFESYGKDGLSGQGTKAAMVGWLLAEAAKADLGMYARANDAFLVDLADGAMFSVDLVGVYGKPEFNFAG